VRPYIRATCNPDADSWVADFLAWWIDPESGLPIRSAPAFCATNIRAAEKLVWADKPEELMRDLPRPEDLPPSIEPAETDKRHLHPGESVRQPRSAAGQPRIFHLAGRHIAATVRDGPPARITGLNQAS